VRVLELSACPLCDDAAAESFTLGDAALRRCRTCELVYASFYADPDDVYVDGYLSGAGPFGIDVSNELFQRYLAATNDTRVGIITQWAGRPGRLLDVGCGSGEFLARAAAAGWDVQGVEPVEQSAEIARRRGVPVISGVLEDSGLRQGDFDVVVANHVLEHMADPVAFIQSIVRWARPSGLVVVEVPNFGSRLRARTGASWIHLRWLEHVCHYTPSTVRAVLRSSGLTVNHLVTPTYVAPVQGVDFALADLGRAHWSRWVHRLPSSMAWPTLRSLERFDRALQRGFVVLACARRG
jgi:SAM-dependent methyltransferase